MIDIYFVHAVETSKATIYTEYLPTGYAYKTNSLDYFISLLKEKNINFVNNVEVMKIHNYYNVINYEYYINIFNTDIVLFESTEYTHINCYFPVDAMIDTVHNKNIYNYDNLNKDNFVSINNTVFNISNSNLNNFSIPFKSEDVLYAYAR